MPFLGNTPSQGFTNSVTKDDFTPNGSTTAFTLSKASNTNNIEVYVGNVRQEPTSSYSVSGTTLTMTEAPATGTNFYVMHESGSSAISLTPAAGTSVPGAFGVSGALTAGSAGVTGNTTVGGTLVNTGLITASAGVAIGGTGSANTLDDYEEGTWTPASNNQGMATIHTAFYTKIGEFVSVYCDITRDSTPSDTSQGTAISGLPFNSGDDYPTGGSIIPGVGESVITVAGGDNMNFRGTDLVPITRSQTAGERCQHYVTYLTL